MISRLGLVISRLFRAIVPDPFVIAVLLVFATAALALLWGFTPAAGSEPLAFTAKLAKLGDAWTTGLWDLLRFGMQMCLILVTGHALAASRPVSAVLRRLAELPRNAAEAAALVALVACVTGVVNWGLGLIAGATIARDVGLAAQRRGVRVHYPVLAAAGYMGLLVFHGGLSGSAPLAMSRLENAKAVLRPEHLALLDGKPIELDRTLGSPLNLVVTGGMVLGLPILFALLMPKKPEDCAEASRFCSPSMANEPSADEHTAGGRVPEWLDRTPIITLGLALLLLAGAWRFIQRDGLIKIGVDQVNMLMLGLGLVFHGSARSYLRAIDDAARGCSGVILQFPIYSGIMAMMSASGLTAQLAHGITGVADARTLPLLTFIAATLVGLFVPSGGAQWSIQGPIALQSGQALGVDPGAMVMAVAYGDQVANMLQPFWALPLLAITGAKARDIVGYTAVAMVAAIVWAGVWLVVI